MFLQVILATALATTSFVADDNATNIIGSWALTTESAAQKRELTMEFTKDGKNRQIMVKGKDKFMGEATYKIEKDKLIMTVKLDGKEETATCTIKELTKTKLVLIEDSQKNELVFTKKKILD